jgi:uncharacterized linocin/CFP29 family protein
MSYLSREASPLSEGLWKQIDSEVARSARNVLTGRHFLHIFGPLGIGVESINVDEVDTVDETAQNGIIITKGRKFIEIPIIYDDFTLLGRDIESSEKTGYPIDLSKAAAAAEACAIKEDRLIYFGDSELGYKGLLTALGAGRIEKKDWGTGEDAFSDVAAAIELLTSKNIYGKLALAVSPDLYMKMHRLQPGTGLLEIDRVSKLVDGHVYQTPVLGRDKAVLACPEPRNMDLVVGQDMATAYLEQKDLNHSFRVLESVMLRIKREQSIVVFG